MAENEQVSFVVKGRKGVPNFFFFKNLLTNFSTNLDEQVVILKKLGEAKLFFVGPLLFRKDVRRQKRLPDLPKVGLVLNLIARMRDWTDTGDVLSYAAGRRMPTHGRPCYKLVATIASTVLSKKLRSRDVLDIARTHHKVGIGHFPPPARKRLCRRSSPLPAEDELAGFIKRRAGSGCIKE